MPKEIPILFSTPMVQAILEGRKTETRREVKPQPSAFVYSDEKSTKGWPVDAKSKRIKCPYGKPGDVLWVRESFCLSVHMNNWQAGEPEQYVYKADNPPLSMTIDDKWKPSIHMPKAAARIWLEVVEVKVERLQDITEESARAEGVECSAHGFKNYGQGDLWLSTAKSSFKTLWVTINGTWQANPWVWVIKFKVLSTTGKPKNL